MVAFTDIYMLCAWRCVFNCTRWFCVICVFFNELKRGFSAGCCKNGKGLLCTSQKRSSSWRVVEMTGFPLLCSWYRRTLYRCSIDAFATSSCFVITGNQRRCHLGNTRKRRKEKRVVYFYNYACFQCWQLSIHLVLTFLKLATYVQHSFSCSPV